MSSSWLSSFAICASSSSIFRSTYGTTCVDDGVGERVGGLLRLDPGRRADLDLDERREVARDLARLDDGGRRDVPAEPAGPHARGRSRPLLMAASLRTISLTVFGFVWRLWSWPPPAGVNGWPR